MHWGYYCRTCGTSSGAWFESPIAAFATYESIMPRIQAHTSGDEVTLPAVQIPMLVFLSSHNGHSLWAECESGVLRLSGGPPPDGDVNLPRFRRQ